MTKTLSVTRGLNFFKVYFLLVTLLFIIFLVNFYFINSFLLNIVILPPLRIPLPAWRISGPSFGAICPIIFPPEPPSDPSFGFFIPFRTPSDPLFSFGSFEARGLTRADDRGERADLKDLPGFRYSVVCRARGKQKSLMLLHKAFGFFFSVQSFWTFNYFVTFTLIGFVREQSKLFPLYAN